MPLYLYEYSNVPTKITKDLCRDKKNLNSKALIYYYFSINSNSELNKFCTIFTKLYN